MNSECVRIADQLQRAFSGDPWHGSPIRDLLDGIGAAAASQKALPSVHTIWELVVHIDLYVAATVDASKGTPMPRWFGTGQDWPAVTDTSDLAWTTTVDAMFKNVEALASAIAKLGDEKLTDTVPGRQYDFYYLFHGVIQHSLYHGGQIAMLKKAIG